MEMMIKKTLLVVDRQGAQMERGERRGQSGRARVGVSRGVKGVAS